ncbi:MAG: putative sugar nucleotidyl transferase [Gemmatimonadota bacterium]
MSPSLFLFDDRTARSFHPFSLTRPLGELLFGGLLLRERAEAFWGDPCEGYLSSGGLAGFQEGGAPPVLLGESLRAPTPRILHSGRFAPSGRAPDIQDRLTSFFCQGTVVGFFLPRGTPLPPDTALLDPEPLPDSRHIELEGQILEAPWDLMARNGEQLRDDIPRFFSGYATDEIPGCHIIGDGLLSVGEDVEVEPGSVFDLREGPIRLSRGARVRALTRLEGPAYVGPGTTILGGLFSELSVGPMCKVRGEVESSIILGYTNKAHDGFLGHAYLGRWVNLGALTTNSDLKNNYGPVRVGGASGPVETGLLKVGAFLGDHVKTGIGTLLNTGTVVGCGSNIFGGAMPPVYVPPFSWGSGHELTEFRLDKFLELARRTMDRRNVILEPGMEELLRRAWEASRGERVPNP